MPVSVIGVDLAKNVFQVHGADNVGRPIVLKQLRREPDDDILRAASALSDRHGSLC